MWVHRCAHPLVTELWLCSELANHIQSPTRVSQGETKKPKQKTVLEQKLEASRSQEMAGKSLQEHQNLIWGELIKGTLAPNV